MFTTDQRRSILIWSTYALLVSSVLLVLVHGLFFFSVLQYYLYAVAVGVSTYYCLRHQKLIEGTFHDIITEFLHLLPKKK